jgi:hypothetical protein
LLSASSVITGLVPVIHALCCLHRTAWMAGTRPAMTIYEPAMTIYEGVNLPAYLVCFNPELHRTAGVEFGDDDAR